MSPGIHFSSTSQSGASGCQGDPAAGAPSPWGFARSRAGILFLQALPRDSAAHLPSSGIKTLPGEPRPPPWWRNNSAQHRGTSQGTASSWPSPASITSSSFCAQAFPSPSRQQQTLRSTQLLLEGHSAHVSITAREGGDYLPLLRAGV